MRLFQAPLDTCLGSPFFASLSVHSLHFTVDALSIRLGNYFLHNSQRWLERGCKKSFGSRERKASCTGGKRGLDGGKDFWETFAPPSPKHLLNPLISRFVSLPFSGPLPECSDCKARLRKSTLSGDFPWGLIFLGASVSGGFWYGSPQSSKSAHPSRDAIFLAKHAEKMPEIIASHYFLEPFTQALWYHMMG